ncbi:MAG: orotate phosphoribosyltransferase [Desulfobacteraceae bacterium Eth-SRB1]|nr:MAG: orotate phosphoribosyltransferase [Desulfobacteraceae bacterium Eth-SRB1]
MTEDNSKEQIAKILLEKEAVTLNAETPYTYVSGMRSPIYCDNRKLTFYPEERSAIADSLAEKIKEIDPEIIAGTASSAISWAALVAERLDKPMVYIRKKSKGYGKDNLIEGGDISEKKVVVVEDLVSTGGSSFNAVKTCLEAGADVQAVVAIFTYEFENAKTKFKEGKCNTVFLTDFSTLIRVAAENNFVENDKITLIREWNSDPTGWGPKHGFSVGEKKN